MAIPCKHKLKAVAIPCKHKVSAVEGPSSLMTARIVLAMTDCVSAPSYVVGSTLERVDS